MSGFSADWLALREPLDSASRSNDLTAALTARLRDRRRSTEPLPVYDLGAGTGASLRALAPSLGHRQAWTLIDDDASMLEAVAPAMDAWARRIGADWQAIDSGYRLDAAEFSCRVACRRLGLESAVASLTLEPQSLVTASALLDLVSLVWLEALTDLIASAGAHCLFALSYDGRVTLDPPTATDGFVIERVNEHQRGDKGFGPALGPTAAAETQRLLERAGYFVQAQSSDWQIAPAHAALLQALVSGWSEAAKEIDPEAASEIEAWQRQRHRAIDAQALTGRVGHTDIAAWPQAD